MKKSRTVGHPVAVESPRHLPLVDLLVDARTELFELAIRSGLKVLETMFEEDRVALCRARYAHMAERCASRAGTVSSEVVLGGRKVAVRRPRVRAAVRAVFDNAALIQRCQVHKMRNVLDYLPERQRPWVQTILRRAYQSPDVKTATRLLQDLARRLEDEYPSAAESVREGLDETLTVIGLGLSQRLQRSLATTNAAESLISRTRHVKRNVKRWRGGKMMLRWVAAGVLEAVKGFRRLKGHRDMPTLVAKLRARDQQLGLAKAEEKVA